VERLKVQALSSSPSTAKKKKSNFLKRRQIMRIKKCRLWRKMILPFTSAPAT
jgi:hypothetical protein